jgi:glycosyltransferase involved in cell wall biosynthesis
MKILRITSIGYEGGGAENGILLLQPILEKMGHTVKIFASDLHPEKPHFSDFEFKAASRHAGPLKIIYRSFNIDAYRKLKKVLAEYQPDIIQLHTMTEVSPSVLFLLKKYPTVLTIHGGEDYTTELIVWTFPSTFFKKNGSRVKDLNLKGRLHHFYHRYISNPIYRLGFKNIDVFVAFSRYMQSYLKKEKIDSILIPNATKLLTYSPIDTASQLITYVGRLEKSKGIDYLIRAIAKAMKEYPQLHLIIAGAGEYKTQLNRLVHQLTLENNVTFAGHQTREQLYEIYKKSSVVAMPSVWPEPFGKVGIEAMSVGRPVIASDVGGISEWLLSGETGFLVPPADESALAEKIITLLSDKKLLQTMSVNARRQAENFSIEKHAQKIEKLYEEIIKRYR